MFFNVSRNLFDVGDTAQNVDGPRGRLGMTFNSDRLSKNQNMYRYDTSLLVNNQLFSVATYLDRLSRRFLFIF